MREIAAASDFDFVSVEPRRPARGSARPGKGRAKKARAGTSWFSAIWRYRTPALGVAALGALLAAVVVNAVYMQQTRHPAPLFGATFKVEAPKPPPRPAHLDALLAEKMPGAALSKVAAPAAALAPPPAAASSQASGAESGAAPLRHKADAIGALLAEKNVEKKSAAAPVAAKTILSAQRALQKLGAPVKPDGAFGATTKKALETFQRDNHLPVTGELTLRTRNLLAARSGLPQE
ncbi:peptidoglycan-binding domain-containing protein [uncultured Rhodoblastus sp.]|uniref:peptidoglycan-binding domain-containing protein n=1 Tax=uncultured Rhodoblastus sp. TaxID=543037 RepID=UPI0025E424AF|nr:peptidoglycan-binding domain-containing protein [uncultured Rhodoblastus sp.]